MSQQLADVQSADGGIVADQFADMDACFDAFDQDGDGKIDFADFGRICSALFRNDKGIVYTCSEENQKEMFGIFDQNKDGYIDRNEFKFCWNKWIKKIVRPVSVLLVIDVQNDFISGSLSLSNCTAKQNGEEVIKPINQLLDNVQFDGICYSLDWHPADHVSFIDNITKRKIHSTSPLRADQAQVYDTVIFDGKPPTTQRLWPRHCVQNSWGAELHKDLKIGKDATLVYKGINSDVDSYSAFFDNKKMSRTCLQEKLVELGATDVYVCGLAYDVCVGSTAADALAIGYRTIMINDCARGVNFDDIESTKKKFKDTHGIIVESSQVKAMVEGRDRRPELGYKLAVELKKDQQK
ncbi:nicotinamidase [Neocloeon triangulifer]|uniref:nicotinamidase n=1 Tax=Neocloeon triangulifer TaxID=2078957 RepID=UPI00286EE54A|nr:nicotinamidase [Neocloeon triangulifer]